ncbi:hypothetical protein D3C81_462860 [compost metagenome]
MRVHVDLLQLPGSGQGAFLQLLDRHHLVEETSIHGADRIEHLGVDHRAVESRAAQAVTGQLDPGVVHGHADLHFVQANAERAFDADAIVGRQQQERPLGHGMARAGNNDRERVRQHAPGQGGAGGDQADRFLRAGGHHLEVVAAGENARLAGDYDYGTIRHRLIQGSIERGNDVWRDGVDLAVVQGQGRDAVFEVVGNQLTHDTVPKGRVEQTLLRLGSEVKRCD